MVEQSFLDSKSSQESESKSLDSIPSQTDENEYSIEYLMGKFNPIEHADFIEVPLEYADQKGRYIRKEVLEAFINMYNEAAKEGIFLKIKSATRNFDHQKTIWENKWLGKTILEDGVNALKDIKNPKERALKILQYSSMPGTSRHHWGTDMDFNSFNNDWFDQGEGLKLYTWLKINAHKYGFCQPYTAINEERPNGYFEEKWHWTYLPTSTRLTDLAKIQLTDEMISGFKGSETALEIGVVSKYILGIHPSCHPSQN